jgi:hypothetical protein
MSMYLSFHGCDDRLWCAATYRAGGKPRFSGSLVATVRPSYELFAMIHRFLYTHSMYEHGVHALDRDWNVKLQVEQSKPPTQKRRHNPIPRRLFAIISLFFLSLSRLTQIISLLLLYSWIQQFFFHQVTVKKFNQQSAFWNSKITT